ncbi:MAG: Xaa-Pro peptidase family protein, partial [Chloroflexota bacterium]
MSVLDRMRAKMAEQGLDAFLVTQNENRRYLSGFMGSAGALLITPTEQYLATDTRYYERVKQEAKDWTLIEASYKTFEALGGVVEKIGLSGAKVGIEADHLTVAQYKDVQKKIENLTFVETQEFVLDLRAIKTESELAAIRTAIALTDSAMLHAYEWIKPGMTEREINWELEVYMRTRGATSLSFEMIVAAGPNGASPHAVSSDYAVQDGDAIVIDMGCVNDGYVSDLTRSFCLGQPKDEDYLKVWEVVRQANENAIANIRPGMTSKDADALARDVITAAGYGVTVTARANTPALA